MKKIIYFDKNGQPGDMPCDSEGNRLHSKVKDAIDAKRKPQLRPPGKKK